MRYELPESFQIEVPKEVRDCLGLKPGDGVAWICGRKGVEFVRVPTVEEMAGTLKGYDVSGYRDEPDPN
ncbi:MAG: AbrB/MazE/SpoVT family DNA-binding domain-containing protein [Acidobacteria bacterium]|nr:AbrB/MazE/SpoVT family DNA-binding domain-containing protein [Acidobacteriota bacterium]